jgi:predicted house-cleaning noncanonical NTP pyrophosphatase (MazG superfamily)
VTNKKKETESLVRLNSLNPIQLKQLKLQERIFEYFEKKNMNSSLSSYLSLIMNKIIPVLNEKEVERWKKLNKN